MQRRVVALVGARSGSAQASCRRPGSAVALLLGEAARAALGLALLRLLAITGQER